MQNISKIVISRSMIKREYGEFYCLGPNVGRVSFVSQQIRALNLVWALAKEGKVRENLKIAVVGAGVSGITAAAALRAYNCTVNVFDTGRRLFPQQRGTTHRRVHPTINWWPDDGALTPTADVLLMGWGVGKCNDIVETLEKFWRVLEGPDLRFLDRRRVKEIEFIAAHDHRATLICDDRNYSKYDVVIVAIGFGDERAHLDLDTTPYWMPDALEYKRERDARKRFVVSGCGDGGQIDALRIAYDFDEGRLSFEIAQKLLNTPIAEILRGAESKLSSGDTAGAIVDYDKAVKEVCENEAFSDILELLKSKLHRDSPQLVLLMDRTSQNSSCSPAAPIHKFLVKFAEKWSVVKFSNSAVVRDKKKYICGGQEFDPGDIIIRHGAEELKTSIVREEEWNRLQEAQQASIKHNYLPAWNDNEAPFPVPDGLYCRRNDTGKFAAMMAPIAQKAITGVGSSGTLVPEIDGYRIYGHEEDLYRPESLFGLKVVYEPLAGMRVAEMIV